MDQPLAPSPLRNWAGNILYGSGRVLRPESIEELQRVVRRAPRLKILGSRHCFNRIADSTELLVSTEKLVGMSEIDAGRREVTVEAGVTYGRLGPYLHERGYALPNLASLPHISVAGAVGTATHGSGTANGSLAAAVVAFDLITATGELRHCDAQTEGARFDGMVVHLGAFGALARITLKVEPTYSVAQTVYVGLPWTEALSDFTTIMGAGYSVSLFTDWSADRIDTVWIKRRTDAPMEWSETFHGARLADREIHPIPALSAENCNRQGGVAGPWHERLPHFRMGFAPSSADELQTEYFVPLDQAAAALSSVKALRSIVSPHLQISELRTVAADSQWMSMAYGRPTLGIHFTWKPDWPSVRQVLPHIEAALAPFGTRPHWGKLFTVAPEQLRARYPRFADFKTLVAAWDPAGKFRNEFLAEILTM